MTSPTYRREFECRDFDHLCELTQGWSLDLSQLEAGDKPYKLIQIVEETAQVSAAYFGASLRQNGDPPPRMITLALPAKGSTPFIWRGYQITENSITVFPEGSELFSISQPGFQIYTYSYLASDLNHIAEQLELTLPPDFFLRPVAYNCCPSDIETIQQLATLLIEQTKVPSGNVIDQSFKQILHDVTPQALLKAVNSNSKHSKLVSTKKRRTALELASDYIKNHIESPITVDDLCQIAQTSERTMQYAFLEAFGISPQQYIKRVRLCEAYRRLRRSCSTSNLVRKVSNQLHLSHSGQFARDYKEFFGELPSETLVK